MAGKAQPKEQNVILNSIGTHPLLTALPIAYPLIKTTEIVAKSL